MEAKLDIVAKENRESLEKVAEGNRKTILVLDEKMAAQLASTAKETQA